MAGLDESLALDLDLTDSNTQQPKQIILIASNGNRHPIDREAVLMSEFIKTTLEGDNETFEIHLYHIDSATLNLCCKFMNEHIKTPVRKIETPLVTSNLKELVSQFDYEFMNSLTQEQTFKLILAANYMNIKPLLKLCAATIATWLKGKTPIEIKQKLNIRLDSTPREEEKIRKDFKDLIE